MSLPAPVAPARKARTRVWVLALVVGLPLVIVVGLAALVVAALASFFTPDYRVGWLVGEGSCSIDPLRATALVELPMSSAERWTDSFNFEPEPLDSSELTLVGVATLAHGDSLDSQDEDGRKDVRIQLDDDDDWASAPSEGNNVILEFRRSSEATETRLDKVTLWWSSGEPAFLQEVPLNLVWSDSGCTVDTVQP